MKLSLVNMLPAALLFAAWFVLVLLGKADAGAFLSAIQTALVGLGVYHTAKPKKESE